MNKKLLSLYGLKWNPFAPEVPAEALQITPRIDSFCWRVENLAREGGFALVTGEPGAGKSAALRILVERLGARALGRFAKLHFRTSYEVGAAAGKLDELPLPVPKEKTEWKR